MNLNISELETVYESTSSNRNENNISTRDGYLLYSRGRCPIIYCLRSKKVEVALFGHQDEVKHQEFVLVPHGDPSCRYNIISVSHDKSAIIWDINVDNVKDYKILHKFVSPDQEVFNTCCCTLRTDNSYYSITTTIEGNICCWKDAQLLSTLNSNYCCLTSNLLTVDLNDDTKNQLTFLFLSGSDNKIHVFQLVFYSQDSSLIIRHLLSLTGYSDWVKCMDILELNGRKNEFLLATASQETLTRIWYIKLTQDQEVDSTRIRTILSNPLETQATAVFRLTATLETVLSGHDGFVHGLCWFKKPSDPNSLQLFTCSADKTIALWRSSIAPISEDNGCKYEQCPASQGVWNEALRLGETGETNLPFLAVCLDSQDERTLFAQSLRGAIHRWRLNPSATTDNELRDLWVAEESITGHYGTVTDLSWEKSGLYLISSSLDKTCRLHSMSGIDNKWHELTRPQVHGHEINCVSSINFTKFASGAEEKTIRIFGATKFFFNNYKQLATTDKGHHSDIAKLIDDSLNHYLDQLPAHAQLPALGLSNRGASSPYDISAGDANQENNQAAPSALPVSQDGSWNEISDLVKQLAKMDNLTELPYEEILLQSTLWWETNKLFGHCNELHALHTDSEGKFLASASKANRVDLAKIFVWECEKFRKVATIEHHSLTITRLRFSPDDNYLLSVSRDRTWSLSERTGQLRNAYKLVCGTNKSNALHERIIWDCCWTHDSRYFMTVSRDKKAIMWNVDDVKLSSRKSPVVNEEQQQGAALVGQNGAIDCVTSRLFHCPIQAVDSLPQNGHPLARLVSARDIYLFAFGFEDGKLELYSISISKAQNLWTHLRSIENFHQLSIRRLAFRPIGRNEEARQTEVSNEKEDLSILLASGADDCVVKLTKISFDSKE